MFLIEGVGVVEATLRPFPDYDKLPDSLYLPLSGTSIDGREPDDFQPRAQMKRKFNQNKLNPGDGETIAEFSENYIVTQKFGGGCDKITTTLNKSNCIILTKSRR